MKKPLNLFVVRNEFLNDNNDGILLYEGPFFNWKTGEVRYTRGSAFNMNAWNKISILLLPNRKFSKDELHLIEHSQEHYIDPKMYVPVLISCEDGRIQTGLMISHHIVQWCEITKEQIEYLANYHDTIEIHYNEWDSL